MNHSQFLYVGKSKPNIGIYMHIPFCKSKCIYCDFCSFPDRTNSFNAYAECLKKEISLNAFTGSTSAVGSVYIGGGTPSFFDTKLLCELIQQIYSTYDIDQDAEISVECNPDSTTEDFVKAMVDNGVNRFSIGLQSATDNLLKILGRPHDFKQFCTAAQAINKHCSNLNVDIMLGLPTQTNKDVENTIAALDAFDVKHVSAYGLIVERGTPLKKSVSQGKLLLPTEDESTDMYDLALQMLSQRGLKRYEVSNFAKKGYECRHNQNYWKWGSYIGLGLNAHSFMHGMRYKNYNKLDKYLAVLARNRRPIASRKTIKGEEACFEYIMLNLRTADGFREDEFAYQFGIRFMDKYGEVFNKLSQNNMLCRQNGRITVPADKLYVLNQILVEFVPSKEG